jgi:hypothetical protein
MFEIAVAVAEETRPWEGRVFSVCVVGLVNEGMATIHKKMSHLEKLPSFYFNGRTRNVGENYASEGTGTFRRQFLKVPKHQSRLTHKSRKHEGRRR